MRQKLRIAKMRSTAANALPRRKGRRTRADSVSAHYNSCATRNTNLHKIWSGS